MMARFFSKWFSWLNCCAASNSQKRCAIAEAKLVFTVNAYRRDGKDHPVYPKVIAAHGPRAVVLPEDSAGRIRPSRPRDLPWEEFLSARDEFDAIPCRPSDPTNILFSSGTTKDPKAIPWTHTTPIKAAADAFLHQDVVPADVLAWPTSFGWMMGPWLTYASLVNRATMALYVGSTTRREFGEFVSRAGVTMLGVVPKLVRAWKADGTIEGLDWSAVRRLSRSSRERRGQPRSRTRAWCTCLERWWMRSIRPEPGTVLRRRCSWRCWRGRTRSRH